MPHVSAGRIFTAALAIALISFPARGKEVPVADPGFDVPLPSWVSGGEEYIDGIDVSPVLEQGGRGEGESLPRYGWGEQEGMAAKLLRQPLSRKVWIGHPLSSTRRPLRGGDHFQFQLGLYRFGKKEYQRAAEAFFQLLLRFEDSPLRSRALFWLGKSRYGSGEWGEAEKAYRILLRENPEENLSAIVLIDLGRISQRTGKLEDALGYYRRFLDGHPDSASTPLVVLHMGEVFYRLGKYDAAAEQFRRVAREFSTFAEKGRALFWWGESLRSFGEREQAQKRFEEYRFLYPYGPLADFALYSIGWCHLGEGRFEEAGVAFQEVLQRFPARVLADEALILSGWSFRREGFFVEAAAAFRKLLEEFPSSPWTARARFLLGLTYYDSAEHSKAREVFGELAEAAADEETALKATFMEALTSAEMGFFEKAFLAFGKLEDIGRPDLEEQSLLRAGWSACRAGRYAEAESLLERLAQRPMAKELAAEIWYWIGVAQAGQGNSAEAALSFGKSLETIPDGQRSDDALFGVGEAYFDQKRCREAANSYRLFLKTFRDSSLREDSLLRLVECLQREEEHDEALTVMKLFLEEHPDSKKAEEVRFGIGELYLRLDDFESAEVEFGRLLEERPGSEFADDALFHTALWNYRQGIFEKAAGQFENLLHMYPKSDLALPSHLKKADALYRLRRFAEARKSYATVVEKHADSQYVPDAEYGINLISLAQGDFQKYVNHSKSFASRYPDNPLTPAVLSQLGRRLLLKKRYDEAADIFSWLMRDYRGAESVADLILKAARADSGLGGRDEEIARLRAELGKSPSGSLEAEYRFELANQYLAAGNCRGALREYRHIIDQHAEHPLAQYALFDSAGCYMRLGEPEESRKSFRRLAETCRDSKLLPGTYYLWGLQAFQQGEYGEAAEALRKVPLNVGKKMQAKTAFKLGRALQKMNRIEEAYQEFLRSKGFDPDGEFSLRSTFRAAGIARDLGRVEEAGQLYREILAAGEEGVIVELAREGLKELSVKEDDPSREPSLTEGAH